MRPGDTERDLGLRYADSLRNLGPLAGPTLQHMLNLRLREVVRQTVVGQAELQSGRLPGRPAGDGRASSTSWASRARRAGAARRARRGGPASSSGPSRTRPDPPVRLVKTIGDAAMLVAPEPAPVLDAVLGLVDDSRDASSARCCVAGWRAARRCRARATGTGARSTSPRGSPPSPGAAAWWPTRQVHDAGARPLRLVVCGQARLKGVSGEVEVFRVRSPDGSGRIVDVVLDYSRGLVRLKQAVGGRPRPASGSSTPPTTCSAGTAFVRSAWTGSSPTPAWRR